MGRYGSQWTCALWRPLRERRIGDRVGRVRREDSVEWGEKKEVIRDDRKKKKREKKRLRKKGSRFAKPKGSYKIHVCLYHRD